MRTRAFVCESAAVGVAGDAEELSAAHCLDTPQRTAWLSGPLTTYNEALA